MHVDKIRNRADELITQGEEVAESADRTDRHSRTYVNQIEFHEWRAASLSFLTRVFGPDHPHTKLHTEKVSFEDIDDTHYGIAILRAARQDIEGGHLKSIESLVSADVFSNFLEMASHLLEQGYKDAAAVLGGAVLEDGLRRVARAKGIQVKPSDDLSALNHKLADAGTYNRLMQKRVQVWAEVRNRAAHGQFDQYDSALVGETLRGIADFLSTRV
jgi:hypothetical protein